MKEEIVKMRVQIDGLAQMTKELKPFVWCPAEMDGSKQMSNPGEHESGIVHVRDDGSFSVNGFGYKYQAITRTDRGTFRFGSNIFPFKEDHFTLDRNSKEINKAYDCLLLAKAWLGKILGSLGEPTPYANDGNRKTVADIEPAADVKQKPVEQNMYDLIPWNGEGFWKGKTHIERVDWLREAIGKEAERSSDLNIFKEGNWERLNCNRYLSEARFWLGFELQRIKENR